MSERGACRSRWRSWRRRADVGHRRQTRRVLAHGIDPRTKKTVALKSMQHFRATYEPLAEKVIVCDSGALATPDFTRFDFKKVRRPMHPFDPDDAFTDLP